MVLLPPPSSIRKNTQILPNVNIQTQREFTHSRTHTHILSLSCSHENTLGQISGSSIDDDDDDNDDGACVWLWVGRVANG